MTDFINSIAFSHGIVSISPGYLEFSANFPKVI